MYMLLLSVRRLCAVEFVFDLAHSLWTFYRGPGVDVTGFHIHAQCRTCQARA